MTERKTPGVSWESWVEGQIREGQVNSRATSGPPTSVMPLNVDRVIQEWRNRRGR